MKKIFAAVISIVIALSCTSVFSAGAEGEYIGTPVKMELDKSYSADFSYDPDCLDYDEMLKNAVTEFLFTPDKTGVYEIFSSGAVNSPLGCIISENEYSDYGVFSDSVAGNEAKKDFDGLFILTGGVEYYIIILPAFEDEPSKVISDEFQVVMKQADYSDLNAVDLTAGKSVTDVISSTENTWYKFVPDDSVNYCFSFAHGEDGDLFFETVTAFLFDENGFSNEFSANSYFDETSSKYISSLTAGKTYYICAYNNGMGEFDSVEYKIDVSKLTSDYLYEKIDYYYASDDVTVDCENAVSLTAYLGNDKDIVIPSEIDGYDVVEIGTGLFIFSDIESVVIPSTVRTISESAFESCDLLEKVTLSDGLVSIMRDAFLDCTELKEIKIPASVKYIGSRALGLTYDYNLDTYVPVKGFILTGESGSAAEKYAGNYSISFKKPAATSKSTTKPVSVNTTSRVNPPAVAKVKKVSVKAVKKALKVSWKKLKKANGYVIEASAKKNFKKTALSKTLKKNKKTVSLKKNLKSGKKYYVRVRAYKTYKNSKGETVKAYGAWKKTKKAYKVK